MRRVVVVIAAVLAALVIAVGAALFQPWRLFTDQQVIEAAPTPVTSPVASAVPSAPSGTATAAAGSTSPDRPRPAQTAARVVATGALISHEHQTSGRVEVVQLPDGSLVVRLVGLDTSDGPDLRVWLSDAPVVEGRAGWHLFDDGDYVNLGALKGNRGDQNYPVPSGTDLADYRSVSIWCDRFNVSFGAAELRR